MTGSGPGLACVLVYFHDCHPGPVHTAVSGISSALMRLNQWYIPVDGCSCLPAAAVGIDSMNEATRGGKVSFQLAGHSASLRKSGQELRQKPRGRLFAGSCSTSFPTQLRLTARGGAAHDKPSPPTSTVSQDHLLLVKFHAVAQAVLYAAYAGLKLRNLLHQFPKCWNHRCKPRFPALSYFFSVFHICSFFFSVHS